MASGIYEIQCLKHGKRYIGSAVDIKSRWRVHRHHLKKGTHHCHHLQSSWKKHGESFFVFSVIEPVDDAKDLVSREQFWIDTLLPEYNVAKVAGSLLGTVRTLEQRAGMVESQREAAKTRIIWNKGKTGVFSAEAIKRISEAAKRQFHPRGFTRSPETCRKMSEAMSFIEVRPITESPA